MTGTVILNILLLVFRGKGHSVECGFNGAIQLLQHAVKVMGRVFVEGSEGRWASVLCAFDLCP